MKYLLDTCVISELIKKKPNEDMVKWFNAQIPSSLFLSEITLAEINKGIYKIEHIHLQKALKLQNWLNTIEAEFGDRILPINRNVLAYWARLTAFAETQGCKIAVMDSLIAATASCYELSIATRNIDDFKNCGIQLVNPFLN